MANYHPRGKLIQGFEARKHPLYTTWANMKARCNNKKCKSYSEYGARGIEVCKEWMDSFECFALDMGLPPSKKHSLDRKDNEKGYCKSNCRWATGTEQCLNRRVFSNSSTGEAGINKLKNGSYNCRYGKTERYNLGRFSTLEDAVNYRNKFIALLEIDKTAALEMTERRARIDSSTGIKGITKNEDGYMVRVTLKDKSRKYLGFSKTLDGAISILNKYNDENGN